MKLLFICQRYHLIRLATAITSLTVVLLLSVTLTNRSSVDEVPVNIVDDSSWNLLPVQRGTTVEPIEEMFAERRRRASEACRLRVGHDAATYKLPFEDKFDPKAPGDRRRLGFYEFSFYNDKYQMLFCTVPKVASTNIKELLLDLLDRDLPGVEEGKKQLPHIHRLIELNSKKELAIRSNYTRILFARHPLERVLSVYRDKYANGWPVDSLKLRHMGRLMVNKYRGLSLKNGQETNVKPPSLREFFMFLRDGGTSPPYDDVHWRPIVKLCDICRVQFDYFGLFDNLRQEIDYIMKVTTGRDKKTIHLPEPSNSSFSGSMDGQAYESLSDKYLDQLPPTLVRQVAERYALDFEMFGYDRQSY